MGTKTLKTLYNHIEKEFESVSKRFQFPGEVVQEWEGTFSWLKNLMALESVELDGFWPRDRNGIHAFLEDNVMASTLL